MKNDSDRMMHRIREHVGDDGGPRSSLVNDCFDLDTSSTRDNHFQDPSCDQDTRVWYEQLLPAEFDGLLNVVKCSPMSTNSRSNNESSIDWSPPSFFISKSIFDKGNESVLNSLSGFGDYDTDDDMSIDSIQLTKIRHSKKSHQSNSRQKLDVVPTCING